MSDGRESSPTASSPSCDAPRRRQRVPYRISDSPAIRQAFIDSAGRFPVSAEVLRSRAEDRLSGDIEIGTRRMWRVVRALVADGLLRRIGPAYHCEGYVRGWR